MRSALTAALLLAAGCGDPPPARVLSVTVEPSDPLDAGDAGDFLRLAERLPTGGLAALRHAVPDLPDWPATSTRTVADLAGREDDRLRAELAGRALARTLADDPGARRWLDALGWSAGRFASVGAGLGVAAVAGRPAGRPPAAGVVRRRGSRRRRAGGRRPGLLRAVAH